MGIDVYMKWDKQTKAEHDQQITGFSIDAGRFGYLRASYGMSTECAILERVFPPKCWKGKEVKLDFKEQSKILPDLLGGYIEGQHVKSDTLKDKTKVFDFVKDALAGSDWQIEEPKKGTDNQERVMWAKSLVEFFKLGMKQQAEGNNPKVYISY